MESSPQQAPSSEQLKLDLRIKREPTGEELQKLIEKYPKLKYTLKHSSDRPVAMEDENGDISFGVKTHIGKEEVVQPISEWNITHGVPHNYDEMDDAA